MSTTTDSTSTSVRISRVDSEENKPMTPESDDLVVFWLGAHGKTSEQKPQADVISR